MTAFRLQFSKKYGRIRLDSEYNNLDPEVVKKISHCLAKNEPFGLEDTKSVYVISPRDLVTVYYTKGGVKWVEVGIKHSDARALEVFISTLLYTHNIFIGPLTVEKFLTAVKILNDEQRVQGDFRE